MGDDKLVLTAEAGDSEDIQSNGDWKKAVQEVVSKSGKAYEERKAFVVLVCGAKGLGKSTLLRNVLKNYFAEENLSKEKDNKREENKERFCYYLDTDVGQCEFTPTGMLSLHLLKENEDFLKIGNWGESPNWYYRQPQHSRYLGDNTPKVHPNIYIDHIKSLESVYRALFKSTRKAPLLINTHGWVQGIGSLLVQGVIDIFSPDIIVHLQHNEAGDAFNFGDLAKIRTVRSPLAHPKPKMSAEVRYSHLLKYFLRQTDEADPHNWFTSSAPFCIRADKVDVVDAGGKLPMSYPFLSLALNAAIVGLVSAVDNGKCHGIGFVRSVAHDINGHDCLIFLVTSDSPETLKRVDTLVLGSERFPLDKLCSQTVVPEDTPYLMHSSELLLGLNEPSKVNKRNLKRRRLNHLKK